MSHRPEATTSSGTSLLSGPLATDDEPERTGRRGAPLPARDRAVARRRRRRILVTLLIAFLTAVSAIAAVGYRLTNQLSGQVGRISGAFEGIDEEKRPVKQAVAGNSLNFLLVGSDSRSVSTGGNGGGSGGGLSDALMLAHLSADRHSASIISIARDSWVEIPGRGRMKINAAYALGGPSLAIWTVEQLTGVRIDHFAAIDFAGFRAMVDAIGGVDIEVGDYTSGADDVVFRHGLNHLDGARALAYVRERHTLPGGDLDRMRRQQNLIRAVLAKASKDPAMNPVDTYQLINAATRSISVDDGLGDSELRSLALSVAKIGSGDYGFLNAPVRGTGWEGDQSVVYLDDSRCAMLWAAVKNDTMASYLAGHSGDTLPAVPQ